jgi:hypothetical protein
VRVPSVFEWTNFDSFVIDHSNRFFLFAHPISQFEHESEIACQLFKADHEMIVACSTLLFDTTANYPNIMTCEKQGQSSINQGAETHNTLLHGKTAKTLFYESQFGHKPALMQREMPSSS